MVVCSSVATSHLFVCRKEGRGLLQEKASYHPRVSHSPYFQLTYRMNSIASHKTPPKKTPEASRSPYLPINEHVHAGQQVRNAARKAACAPRTRHKAHREGQAWSKQQAGCTKVLLTINVWHDCIKALLYSPDCSKQEHA